MKGTYRYEGRKQEGKEGTGFTPSFVCFSNRGKSTLPPFLHVEQLLRKVTKENGINSDSDSQKHFTPTSFPPIFEGKRSA